MADLKEWVYRLYLEAGTPPLDEIAAWIAEDDSLAGAPGRDTINRVIRAPEVPPAQADVLAVVTVLARAARWEPGDAAARAGRLWVAARLDLPLGVPIDQVRDPFALEVHRPIVLAQADEASLLPRYIRRAHDQRLSALVDRAVANGSGMAVLVAGSSAGKTRACWEALELLRATGGWRLWHPYNPTRQEAALASLDRVGPRTVVWLNETQEYLGGEHAERIAAKLRNLLTDPSRAPVLGTLWPEHHAVFLQVSGSQVRQVLEDTVIEVPESFVDTDLTNLKRAADEDARLVHAIRYASDGQVTQYLAGAPELLKRFHTAPAAAKAIILAAMDARRLGHRNALSSSLLAQAALAYLTDSQFDQLGENWLEEAMAYVSQPCKGALGPITRVRRARRSRRTASTGEGQPLYQLADYLEQYGRAHRASQVPPVGFWTAAASHAHPGDMTALGEAAWYRGLYRDAAQLLRNATYRGATDAALCLVDYLHTLHPDDVRPSAWAATHVPVANPDTAASLVRSMHKIGATDQAIALAERAAVSADLANPSAVERLLAEFQELGASDQIAAMLAREPAAHATLGDLPAVGRLLTKFHEVGADEQVAALAHRAAAHAAVNDLSAVAHLLEALHKVGAIDQTAALVARIPAHDILDNPADLEKLLRTLHEVEATDHAAMLARHVAEHTPLNTADTLDAVGWAMLALNTVGAEEQIITLGDRLATRTVLDEPRLVGWVLEALYRGNADDQIAALLARAPGVHVALDDPSAVAWLLTMFHRVGATEQIAALVTREPAAHAALGSPIAVVALLTALHTAGAVDEVATLADHIATHTPMDDPCTVGWTLEALHRVGAARQVTVLADRAVTQVPLDHPYGYATAV